MKTWKKIEETKKRTNDVVQLKQRNENKLQKQVKDMQDKQAMQNMHKQNNYMVQKQRQEEKKKIQTAIGMSKAEEARQTKLQRKQNEIRKQQYIS